MEFNRDNLHHAYVLIGDRESLKEAPSLIFTALGVRREGNPDVFAIETESLSIDEARVLSARAEVKAFGERKILLVHAARIGIEAQNALLKTLEEPPQNTHFFILTTDASSLLPTLLSRVQRIDLGNKAGVSDDAKKFLSLPPKDRLLFAKKFVDDDKNLAEFLDELLLVLRKTGKTGETEKVFTLRLYANDRSASARMILEHVALVV